MLLYAFGDSLTYGYDVPASGWLQRLQRSHPAWEIRNFGACGAPLYFILKAAARELGQHTPDLVFLMGGLNDICIAAENNRNIARELADQLTAALAAYRLPVLIGAPPVPDRAAVYHGWLTLPALPVAQEATAAYGALLCERFGERVLDFRRLIPPDETDDGVHPNIRGYARMAEYALPYFEQAATAAAQKAETESADNGGTDEKHTGVPLS